MKTVKKENNTEEIIKELDRDSIGRNLVGTRKKIMDAVFIAFAVIMLIMTLVVENITEHTRLTLFLGMILFVGYLKFPVSKKMTPTKLRIRLEGIPSKPT